MDPYVEKMEKWIQSLKETYQDAIKVKGNERITASHRHNRVMKKIEEIENYLNFGQRTGEFETVLSKLARETYEAFVTMIQGPIYEKEEQAVPIGGHQLPPLPYAYEALEPYISTEIMYLHHDKHHRSYVDGLNQAELAMKSARETGDYSLLKHWEQEAAYHGAGHYLHSIFWEIMSPKGGGEPSGLLAEQIKQDFGSFEKMKEHFSEAANQVEGSGWAILVWSPRSRRLQILQAEKHQNLTQQDVIPLLVLDVWEHAYYLQYKHDRKSYIENWFHIVSWKTVENRFLEAIKLKWNLT